MPHTHRRVNVAAQIAASLFREADEWRAKGELVNEQKALDAARAQLKRAGIDSREAAVAKASERVPFTAAEEAQRVEDEAADAAAAARAEAARAARAELVAKLNAGTATPEEVQAALAQLLGGA